MIPVGMHGFSRDNLDKAMERGVELYLNLGLISPEDGNGDGSDR